MNRISVQRDAFSVSDEYEQMSQHNAEDGAIVLFVGRVRDLNEGDPVHALTLEHYPGMTENTLKMIVEEARERWPLNRVRVIHRVGQLFPSDPIVLVATSSPHREAAFAGAQFIMDFLKTQAPFWKKESTDQGDRWVDAKDSDANKANQW